MTEVKSTGALIGRELHGNVWVTGEVSTSGVAVTQPWVRVHPWALKEGVIVAAAALGEGKRAVAHAARVTWATHGDDGQVSYTLHAVCPTTAILGQIGALGFEPDATHHGYRRTCQACAEAVRNG